MKKLFFEISCDNDACPAQSHDRVEMMTVQGGLAPIHPEKFVNWIDVTRPDKVLNFCSQSCAARALTVLEPYRAPRPKSPDPGGNQIGEDAAESGPMVMN